MLHDGVRLHAPLIFDEYQNDTMIVTAASDVLDKANDQYLSSSEMFGRNTDGRTTLMVTALSEFVTEEGEYEGPRYFGNGVVAEIVDGKAVYPEEMPEGIVTLSKEELEDAVAAEDFVVKELDAETMKAFSGEEEYVQYIETPTEDTEDEDSDATSDGEGLADEGEETEPGAVTSAERTGSTHTKTRKESSSTSSSRQEADDSSQEEPENGTVFYIVKALADDLYYVDIFTVDEVREYILNQNYVDMQLQAIEKAYDRGIMVIKYTEGDGSEELELAYDSTHFAGIKDASELGVTRANLDEETVVLFLESGIYSVAYKKVPSQDLCIMCASPIRSYAVDGLVCALFILLIAFLIYAAIIVYLRAVPRYVKTHELTEEQKRRYAPRGMRTIIASASLAGALLIFATAYVALTVWVLHSEIVSGSALVETLFDDLEEGVAERDTNVERSEGKWYAQYASRIASLISGYPELGTPEMLQKYCDALDIDYLMVFDAQGNEVASSNGYTGFTLGEGEDENEQAFRNLLHGVSPIVCKPTVNSVTGLERHMVGAPIPSSTGRGVSGAIVMAVPPERMRQVLGEASINEQLEMVIGSNALFFVADEETGTIRFASDDSMVGSTIIDCGLGYESLRDNYMDFGVINGTGSFVITSKSSDMVHYYSTDQSASLAASTIFVFATASTICYAIVLAIILLVAVRGYRAAWTERENDFVAMVDAVDDVINTALTEQPVEGKRGILALVKNVLFDTYQSDERTPEQRTRHAVSVLIFILALLMICYEIFFSRSLFGIDSPLLSYVLDGDWMRGPNIFALCGIILTSGGALFIYLALKRVVRLVSSFLDAKGKTVCRLLLSFFKYFTYILVAYFSFSYLGFPTNTIMGSLGLGGFAISLGAKDLISDIVAGIFIVFEDQFQVGDIIEVAGFRGTVKEIGVRSTKLVDFSGNVKIVGNMDVKNVLNLTRYDSTYVQTVNVPLSVPLEELEDMLRTELPPLKERCKEILEGPTYLGISAIAQGYPVYAGGVMTVAILVKCKEQDHSTVSSFLNRELILLFERHGIQLAAPPRSSSSQH